jgi:Lon protease-like protein
MELRLFPLRTVLFPGALLPLHIFEPRYRQMIGECLDGELPFGVVLIRNGSEVGGGAEPYTTGCTARITRVEKEPDGRMNIVSVGQDRFRIRSTSSERPYLLGEVELLDEYDAATPAAETEAERLRATWLRFIQATLALQLQWTRRVGTPGNPGRLADHVAARLPAPAEEKQRLLEELAVPRRLARLNALLDNAVTELEERVSAASLARYAGFGVLN